VSFLFVEIHHSYWTRSRRSTQRTAHLECDECCQNYTKPFTISASYNKSKMTFCSVACQNSSQQLGGTLDELKRKVFQENMGVGNPSKVPETLEKIRATTFKNYGVEYCLQSPKIKEKQIKTCLQNLEVTNPSKSDFVKQRKVETCLTRYGVDNPMKIPHVKEVFPWKEVAQKASKSRTLNGVQRSSRHEDRFYERLVEEFSEENVLRWVAINGWTIDFYIKNLDRFVEFDGVYWHTITDSSSVQSKAINEQVARDRRKDQWFRERGFILERITDLEFENFARND